MKRVQEFFGRALIGVIAGAFFASAMLRMLGVGVSASAAEGDVMEPAIATDVTEACDVNENYLPILKALQEREVAAAQKEEELIEKSNALTEAESAIRLRLSELRAAEQSLRGTIEMAREASETDIDQLTQVYENMKPKEAAALFEQMESAFAAGFLGRMSPKAAADILSGLDAGQAYAISVHLAGRNADIPLK